MQSINPDINAIHRAYCEATSFELPMLPVFERQWFDALKTGLTPDMVRLVIKERTKRIAEGVRRSECLLLRNIAGSEEAVADVIQEAAAIMARKRVKVYSAGKAEVLRATGRSGEPEPGPMRPISEVIEQMRKEVG